MQITFLRFEFVSKQMIISVCKKTHIFFVCDKKTSRTRLAEFLKTRSLLIVNDCFKNEQNAVFGVFLQRLINYSCESMVEKKL